MFHIERIDRDIFRKSKKWEFIYANEYVDGILYPFKPGNPYIIYYLLNKSILYTDLLERPLVRIKNFTLYEQYMKLNPGLFREIYLKPHQYIITQRQREQGFITRYFAKYKLDKGGKIFEIKKQDFSRETNFYDKVSLEWQLQGSKESILLSNNKALEEAEKTLKGIKDFVDPLEFYEEEITPEQMIIEKLERLLHNPHEYNTPEQARSAATTLGISGIHRKSGGKWVPGSTQEVYLEAIKKDKITTSTGIEISTRNIVSRY